MIEDKLTPAQRIRLECIAQATMRLGPYLRRNTAAPSIYGPTEASADVIADAARLEDFILGLGQYPYRQ